MKIGILGTGNMGSGLGKLWADAGHSVFFGSREPEKAQALAQATGVNARGGTSEEAAAFGEVVLLSVPYNAAEATVKALSPALAGKILIDLTNAFAPDGGALLPNTTSAAEEIAHWLPNTRVVKAFNSIHFRNLGKPPFGNLKADVYLCADDAQAKAAVTQLVIDAGFEPIDSGALKNARYVEALVVLWIKLAFEQGMGGETAFKLLRRDA